MNRVEILLPKPFDHGFDYLAAEGMELKPGDYVRVPFGKQSLIGVVWGEGAGDVPPEKLKSVSKDFSDIPPVRENFRSFIEWVARYTLSPKGMVLKMALPVESAIDDPRKRIILKKTKPISIQTKTKPLTTAQAHIAEELAEKLGAGFSVTLIDGVTGSGKTEVYFDSIDKLLVDDGNKKRGQLTESALSVRPSEGQEARRKQLKDYEQILVLLPEIALSTQWIERCKTRFGFDPVVWHSGITPAQRRDSLRAIMTGEARLIVGARSALFLPYRNLGLIVVDEEHEPSYKQEDGIIYQARDMAVARAHHEKIPVFLVSATPSLETLYNVREKRYTLAHLPERHSGVDLPEVKLIDMRAEKLDRGSWIAPTLRAEIAETLARKRQTMLFLNRRGYAPLLLCRHCGHRFACPNCSSWMVVHGKKNKRRGQQDESALSAVSCENQRIFTETNKKLHLSLRCHHCDHREQVPKTCPSCSKEESFAACGPGVERVAEEVAALFPQARVEIMTSDTMDNLETAAETVGQMTDGKIDILIGTQMMAKGYHFPALHLIGVIDADLGLQGGDLRAGERTYQLLHQVAGRAGREQEQGKVLLQTYLPEHPVMAALAAYDRKGLENLELSARQDSSLPPYGRLAAIIIDGPEEQAAQQACRQLAQAIPYPSPIEVLGPAPAPLSRLRGRYRYRFFLRAPKNMSLQNYIRQWLGRVQLSNNIRLRVDIDPYSFS